MAGISNITNVTFEDIVSIANVSSYPEFLINVNNIIYNGWFWFIMLCVLWVILFKVANDYRDELVKNAMYSGAVVTVLSFLLRAVYIVKDGVRLGLLTDHQMWIFPIITILLGIMIWGAKD